MIGTYTMDEKLRLVRNYSRRIMPNKPYHNFNHAEDVAESVKRLAKMEGMEDKLFILKSAAYLHDIVHGPGEDNEEKSAELAEYVLREYEYDSEEISEISRLILVTKSTIEPESLLEMIMCDSDLDNLGRNDFFEKCNLLREELGEKNYPEWYFRTLNFLERHKYYTESAKRLRGEGLRINIHKLKEMIIDFPR